MKILLTLFGLALTLTSFSQSRIGSSEKEIRQEFYKNKQTTGIVRDTTPYLSVVMEDSSITDYYFNRDYICIYDAIIPYNIGQVNFLAELYNKKYTIISNKEWKAYAEDGIFKIKLIYENKTMPYFMITIDN